MQKLVDRYITYHFITKSSMTIMIFLVIFLLVDIVENLDHIIDSEIPTFEIFKYYFYAIPWYVSLSLPMSLLLGIIFTNGTLQKNNELTAIKSAGISIKRISIPLIALGIIFSIFSFYFDNTIVTELLQKRNDLGIKYNLVRLKKNNIKQKYIYRQESANTILGINRYNFRNQTAHNISILKFNNNKLNTRLDSPIMQWNPDRNTWELKDFHLRSWEHKTPFFYQKSDKDTTLNLNFDPTSLTQTYVKPEEMNYWELEDFVKKLNKFGIQDPKWAVNMHFKSAFACSSFLMILFGLSLSIRRPRSTLALGIGTSIIVIFIYYAAITTGRSFGFNGTIDPFLSVWIPNLFFFIIGSYLFYKIQS